MSLLRQDDRFPSACAEEGVLSSGCFVEIGDFDGVSADEFVFGQVDELKDTTGDGHFGSGECDAIDSDGGVA